MRQEHELIEFTNPERLKEVGLPFKTEHSVRWAHRRRFELGIAEGFVKLGRRWYVDRDRMHEVIRQPRQ